MTCINLKIRTKKKTRIIYCKFLRKEITYDRCKNCKNKQYKEIKKKIIDYTKNKPIKGKKHKITKATEIRRKVKQIVWERDNHKCIYCGKYVPIEYANSHYIKRSQLGMGVPENIVTACPECHYEYDFGANSDKMKNYTKKYLKSFYNEFNEENLKYKKTR